MIHFDAHADTGDIEFGSLWGHGQPMRRLIESGALRGDRFLQIGLRGYWPPPETLDWMAAQNMRSYEMTEIVQRGLTECLTEAFAIATDECDGVFLSVDIDVCDPGHAPGTGTPEPGGLSARELLDAVRRICLELPVVGMDVVEVSPPYDHADITAALANRVVLEALCAIARKRRISGRARDGIRCCPLLSERAAPIPGGDDPRRITTPISATIRRGEDSHERDVAVRSCTDRLRVAERRLKRRRSRSAPMPRMRRRRRRAQAPAAEHLGGAALLPHQRGADLLRRRDAVQPARAGPLGAQLLLRHLLRRLGRCPSAGVHPEAQAVHRVRERRGDQQLAARPTPRCGPSFAGQPPRGQRPKVAMVFFDAETERICDELGYDLILPSAELREHLDSKLVTTRLGNEVGAASVPNVLVTVEELRRTARGSRRGRPRHRPGRPDRVRRLRQDDLLHRRRDRLEEAPQATSSATRSR